MTPPLEAAERLMKAGVGGFADPEDLRLVCEAVREKCASPGVAQCALLWESDHQRAALEAAGLADEFPYGCDAIAFVAAALIAARAKLAEMPRWRERPTEPGLWLCWAVDQRNRFGFPNATLLRLDAEAIADGVPFESRVVFGPIPVSDKEQA
jgi:hypothetical protein